MKTSCINNPANDTFIIIRTWQVEFCQGDHCAAALLSFLTYFHDLKVEMALKNKRSNDIAELHKDSRTQDESTLQFHSMEELMSKTLHLFGKNKIRASLELLESLRVISVHKNPNERYAFDKTKYFQLHPEVCNDWLKTFNSEQNHRGSNLTDRSPHLGQSNISDKFLDQPKQDDRESHLGLPSSQLGQPSPQMGQAITEITNNNTYKDTTTAENQSHADTTVPDPSSQLPPIAAAVINNFIGKTLTETQRQMVHQLVFDELVSTGKISAPEQLCAEIEICLLDKTSFSHAGNDFKRKLNTIRKAIRERSWRAPVPLVKAGEPLPINPEIKVLQNAMREESLNVSTLHQQIELLTGIANETALPLVNSLKQELLQKETLLQQLQRQFENLLRPSISSEVYCV